MEEETWDHVWKRCRDWERGEMGWTEVFWVLGEEENGEEWLREIERERGEQGCREGMNESVNQRLEGEVEWAKGVKAKEVKDGNVKETEIQGGCVCVCVAREEEGVIARRGNSSAPPLVCKLVISLN